MNISITLSKAARLYRHKVAVICGRDHLTYGQVDERVRRLAQFFVSTGLKPGDVVSVLLPNCHVFLETYYAAALAGVILNPINHRLSGNLPRMTPTSSAPRNR
ncbi:MAG: AMP-binding protein [Deltaproteobacteria bacterium]|nr:AMP-binding protein [Deltaproteobacteria bacterium]